MELTFEALAKDYGTKHALRGVSFTLGEGVHGLLGPNGAGKSTMMNILSGNLRQTSGRICYNGTDIRTLGKDFRSVLGYMPQQQALYPRFSCARFLAYAAALRGMTKAQTRTRIPEVLEMVELSEAANRPIRTLSGGMKQRLLIAQAILSDPEVLLLDEPTAGLDPRQRIAIRNLIASIAIHKIVILSTHVVSDVEYIARDFLLLREGELLQQATRTELTHAMQDRVFELTVPEEELPDNQARYCVANVAREDEGVRLRLLTDEPPAGAAAVSPTMEDVYLHYFGE